MTQVFLINKTLLQIQEKKICKRGDKKLHVHLTQSHSPKITGRSIRQIRDAMLINNEQPNARIQRPIRKNCKKRQSLIITGVTVRLPYITDKNGT